MRKQSQTRLFSSLGLGLLLAGCAQLPAEEPASPYANGADYPWSYTRPADQLSVLSLTPGVNTLYYEPILAARNGWGPIEIDRSNGEQGAGDGRTLTLNGRTYRRGFGTHAGSELRYGLQGTGAYCTQLNVDIGVDDEVGSRGSVVFQVFLDGRKVYDSGVMTGSSATRSPSVNITGARELRLVVTDAGDGKDYDHADWANPRVICTAGSGPASGTLDPGFGTGGIINVGGKDAVLEPGNSVALADSLNGVLALRRLFPDGRVQQVLGQDGATAIARQTDGKLVLAGHVGSAFTLTRYNADLSLDTTFGSGGAVITPVNGSKRSEAYAVKIQPDGRIVVAGSALVLKTPAPGVAFSDMDVALARYTATGQLDASFGMGGMTVQDFNRDPGDSADDSARALVVQFGGGIVVAGRSVDGSGGESGLLTRFTRDGRLDTTFVTSTTGHSSVLNDVAADAAGRLLVVGTSGRFDMSGFLGRYSGDGELQLSRAVSFTDPVSFQQDMLVSVALQGDGKVLVSGATGMAGSGDRTVALARFDADLQYDMTFGTAGKVLTTLKQPLTSPRGFDGSLLVQPDGRIVVVGQQTARFFP